MLALNKPVQVIHAALELRPRYFDRLGQPRPGRQAAVRTAGPKTIANTMKRTEGSQNRHNLNPHHFENQARKTRVAYFLQAFHVASSRPLLISPMR